MAKRLLPALAAAATVGSSAADDLHPGKLLPDIALPSIADGERVALRDHHGKKLMLHLFASW